MYDNGFNPPMPPRPGQPQGFRPPRLGMGGTVPPTPRMPVSPQGQLAVRAAMANQNFQRAPMGMNAPIPQRMSFQANQNADQGGVVSGQQSMPAGGEMSQAERERQMASYGPQNAALAGYMGG